MWPTRKWWASTVVGVTGVVVLGINAGEWTSEVTIAVVTIVSQRIIAFLVPNNEEPGGVPGRGRRF